MPKKLRRSAVAPALAALAALSAPVAAEADAGAAAPRASRSERLQDFAAALSAHGEWLDLPRAGKVWRPVGLEPDWRPYFHGSWTWTEEGWFWVTDEP